MRKLAIAAFGVILTFAAYGGAALADKPAVTTFIAVLSSDEETGLCAGIANNARGVAIFHVTDEATGTVEWRLVANNLPGTTSAAHIHRGPRGVAGPVVQGLSGVAGNEQGVIGTGSFSNPALLAAMRADLSNYYVNVHTTARLPGRRHQRAVRGPRALADPLRQVTVTSPASPCLPHLRLLGSGRGRDVNAR